MADSRNFMEILSEWKPDWMALLNGFSNAINGTYLSMQNSNITGQFKKFMKPFLLITFILYGLGIALTLFLLPIVVIFPGIFLQMFSLIPFWSFSITQRFVPKALNRLFMAELRHINPSIAEEFERGFTETKAPQRWWLPVIDDARRSWHFSKYSLALTALSIIPVVGAIAAFIGQSLLVADRLSWNLFSIYTQSAQHMNYKQEKRWMRENRWSLLGFTLPFAFITSVPVVGPLILGFAQAASAHLFVNELYVKPAAMSEPIDAYMSASPALKKNT